MRFQNGSNKVAIELQVVQFWPQTIFVISNHCAGRSVDFEITRTISDQSALHSVLFSTSENTIIFFFCLPNFCISIVSSFSWTSNGPKRKQTQCLIKILGRQTKNIMVFSELANYHYYMRASCEQRKLLCIFL